MVKNKTNMVGRRNNLPEKSSWATTSMKNSNTKKEIKHFCCIANYVPLRITI